MRCASTLKPLLLLLLIGLFAGADGEVSLRCAACDRPIVGRYVTALGRQWHPEHFVCAACGRSIADERFFERGGRPYCADCFRERSGLRCAICGQPIVGEYIQDYWGERYHARHRDEFEICSSCQRPLCPSLTGGGVRYQDGRFMCALCRRTAVDSLETGSAIMAQVLQELEGLGLAFGKTAYPLRLVDQDELAGMEHASPVNGRTRTRVDTRNGRAVRRRIEEIMILHGLPDAQFGGVVAHELGHVYLFERQFPRLPAPVQEGFCELLACLWLQRRNYPDADFQIYLRSNSEDPVYGNGLRAALRSLEGRTLLELIGHVRQHRRFPE